MTDTTCQRPPIDTSAPLRSRIAATLAVVACVGCCALPYLIVAGVLTGAGAAVAQQALIAGAFGLGALALGMWWLHRRRAAKRAAAEGASACGDAGCAC